MNGCLDAAHRDDEIFRCGIRAAIIAFLLTDKDSELLEKVFDARMREMIAATILEVMNRFDACQKEKILMLRRMVNMDERYHLLLDTLTWTKATYAN